MIAVEIKGKTLHTPAKKPVVVPTRALADAIAAEWEGKKIFSPQAMKLTALAYTAIDHADRKDTIVEVLLAYVDTDTICYRSSTDIALRQAEQWDPVLQWAEKKFGAKWEVTTAIMPLSQSKTLHRLLKEYLEGLDDMRLAACLFLASLFSSLALALAVTEKHLEAKKAFQLSRLEEELQAEKWGRDEEAEKRTLLISSEVTEAARFLSLLDAA